MCGIIGCFTNSSNLFELLIDGFRAIEHRGRDAVGVYDKTKVYHFDSIDELKNNNLKSNFFMGHNLHAIVNHIPQPLESPKSIFVMNGEIYNWETLKEMYNINAENDSDLFHKLIDKLGIEKAIDTVRGVYAFAYYVKDEDKIYIARDLLGVKPIWYHFGNDKFLFSSEKKSFRNFFMQELNPRQILIYDFANNKIKFVNRNFFSLEPINKEAKALSCVLQEAMLMRIPKQHFGLLFSGGVDSVVIARILKNLGANFTCYTSAVSEDSPDLIAAKEAAEKLGLKLKYKIVSQQDVEELPKVIVPLVEDNNVIKVGVALTMFVASQLAKEDNCRIVFTGSGADELFAGYNRYKNSSLDQLNKDCYSDILKVYEKNCYRDDVVTMYNGLELRVPFLDKEVVEYSLRIAPELKIKKGIDKWILRKLAIDFGIPSEIAYRKKKAAQYGSGFDKIIKKLAKKEGLKKSEYLRKFYSKDNLKLGALISSGKDGLYAAYVMEKQNYDISCFITIDSKNKDSFMFHTPNINLVELQAKAAGVGFVLVETEGEKEDELEDLKKALIIAKERYNIDGVITGALFSNYQRTRIEKIADSLGLKIFSPLWHIDQEYEMRQLLLEGFKFVFSSVAAEGLDKSWLGKIINEDDINKLVELNKKIGLNVAGEGGEFESLVLDCPLFNKELVIKDYDIVNDNNSARMIVKEASLKDKYNNQ